MKGRKINFGLLDKFKNSDSKSTLSFDYKSLEQDKGFLVHISMTYLDIVLYLKGIHRTLDSWKKDRDAEIWKLQGESDWVLKKQKL